MREGGREEENWMIPAGFDVQLSYLKMAKCTRENSTAL